ncbi:hypothetical protein [Pandoraea terrigena]|uniref:Protocatechuate 4,5-dioxygenase beta chain n=1 Tax=Pandoraea terrigena TaxID=2508292 RepID=A0A5E4VCP7_9BURK|nr:hypothetical protein [Pandoraea terrigena]VVE10068.1 Protocatechuate 4,5-dioxygenase beta chain [Pandoraea terrigena]
MRPPVELHRLISAAMRSSDLAAQLRSNPDEVYVTWQVPEWQRELLSGDLWSAMEQIGVHPNLRFKFLALRGQLQLKSVSVAPFLDSLKARH